MCIFITLYTNHCAMLYRAYIIIQPSNSYMAKLRYLVIIILSNFRSSEYNRNSFSRNTSIPNLQAIFTDHFRKHKNQLGLHFTKQFTTKS